MIIPIYTNNHLGDNLILSAAISNVLAVDDSILFVVYTNYGDVFEGYKNVKACSNFYRQCSDSEPTYIGYPGDEHTGNYGSLYEGFTFALSKVVNLKVPVKYTNPVLYTKDICLDEFDYSKKYWVINAGYILNVLTKAYPHWYEVVSLCPEITFVQVGADLRNHVHRRLNLTNVIDLVNRTSTKQLLTLVKYSQGTISPVSALAHIAQAYDKPAITILGGREPLNLFKYDKLVQLHNLGVCEHTTKEKGCMKFTGCPFKIDNSIFSKCMMDILPNTVANAIKNIK